MSSEGDDPVFDGEGRLTCESFIRSIRRRSLSADKQTDDQWIALTAAASLDGLALRWYEDLNEETQESWKLLRRAMLVQWPRASTTSSGISTPASSVPTPAAPRHRLLLERSLSSVASPPPRPPVSRSLSTLSTVQGAINGRIKVLRYDNHTHIGYISGDRDPSGDHRLTSDVRTAITVQWSTPTDHPSDFAIISPRTPPWVFLGLTWGRFPPLDSDNNLKQNVPMWGSIASLSSNRNPKERWSSTSTYTGTSSGFVWNVMLDGTVIPFWETKTKSYHRILVAVIIHPGHGDHGSFQTTNDFEALRNDANNKNEGYSFFLVRLQFETLQ